MTFEDLRLKRPLLDAVRAAGYDSPTPIQAQAIPLILDRQDILGCAQTGTGKTAAFALPILQNLGLKHSPKHKNKGQSRRRTLRALIVAPTRELAQQISDSFTTYGRKSSLRHTVVFGGVNKNGQVRSLRNGVDILVATPGRLLDHMSDGTVSLDKIEILVLDEADHMLDMGFLPDIRRILTKVPTDRQTVLLSATMPREIRKLAHDILDEPVSVEVARVSAPAERVEHLAYQVEKKEKPSLLCHLLTHTAYSRALVFTRTKYGADKVVRHLNQAGVTAAAIHGNKSQNVRRRTLTDFRSGKTGVLVATDIAARGLDIDDVSHVINYDLTHEPETYVHRIGRTGRAGSSGTALSFVSRDDRGSLRDIERLIDTTLQPAPDLPGYEPAPIEKPKTYGKTSQPRNGHSKRQEPQQRSKHHHKAKSARTASDRNSTSGDTRRRTPKQEQSKRNKQTSNSAGQGSKPSKFKSKRRSTTAAQSVSSQRGRSNQVNRQQDSPSQMKRGSSKSESKREETRSSDARKGKYRTASTKKSKPKTSTRTKHANGKSAKPKRNTTKKSSHHKRSTTKRSR